MRAERPRALLLDTIRAAKGSADTRVERTKPTATADDESDPGRNPSGTAEAMPSMSDTSMRDPGPRVYTRRPHTSFGEEEDDYKMTYGEFRINEARKEKESRREHPTQSSWTREELLKEITNKTTEKKLLEPFLELCWEYKDVFLHPDDPASVIKGARGHEIKLKPNTRPGHTRPMRGTPAVTLHESTCRQTHQGRIG
jgi:hypothetical protein